MPRKEKPCSPVRREKSKSPERKQEKQCPPEKKRERRRSPKRSPERKEQKCTERGRSDSCSPERKQERKCSPERKHRSPERKCSPVKKHVERVRRGSLDERVREKSRSPERKQEKCFPIANRKGRPSPERKPKECKEKEDKCDSTRFFIVDGIQGSRGEQGFPGLQGPPGPGSLVPFSSVSTVALTTVLGGLTGTVALVGPSASTDAITITAGTIDLTGGPAISLNVAPSVARDGVITALNAYFSNTIALSLVGSALAIQAQLWTSFGNTFTAVPGAAVSFHYTGVVGVGTLIGATITGLTIPITVGTRYMLVFSATATGVQLVDIISGYAGGSIVVA